MAGTCAKNVWGNADRHRVITLWRLPTFRADDLVSEITDALTVAGNYVTLISMEPTHRLADFTRTARQ